MEKAAEDTGQKRTDVAVKGEAAIRPEFLTSKEKFHGFIDSEWQGSKGEKASDNDPVEETKETCVEPEAKKLKLDPEERTKAGKPDGKRLRGQNKSRPHTKPTAYDEKRLCLSVIQVNRECPFGDKCHFHHDVSEYMASKPADIGESCYLYDTFGKCAYGLSCRFAKAHTTPDFKTMENTDLVKAYEARNPVKNSLSKDLQNRLRKHLVAFKKSAEYLKTLSNNREKKEQQGNSEACTAEVPADPTGGEQIVSTEAETQLQSSSDKQPPVKTVGPLTDADVIKLRPCEKKQVDFQDKLYLAPLTTCGNLPFRRVCKRFGADITCGEMAMCTNLLQGQQSEWALLKRHESEDLFGVQVEGCFPDTMTRCAELINNNTDVDFVDINSGCPIDLVYKKGGGCGLMTRTRKFEQIVKGMNYVLDVPLTVKIRTGVQEKSNIAHKLIPELKNWGVSMITLHGRSREQRYTKLADWDYITTCSKLASPVPLFGNGDILSYEDAVKARETGVSGIMIARGALIKPWIFTEIKESRHWDISSSERLDILRDFTNFGLEHWGSDTRGVEKTRTFMLEWLSFMCRYIPVGLLERVPQKINERPPYFMGRNYLESLMASQNVGDWVRISEMLLGPVPKNFNFLPKHKANAYK
ncbi:tRNA-dihydrouridine(47) synthase [NAD(P)(+)]-like [Xiphias gladius]|uniref:tRNA-dihydrouridine(47) synthase [NAD(P)(+)]-like n=1 Tax=Xiphias gladius TaxID=8245 RepID=UPI001A97F693|nr:tRNA-dihydrouridine(47) synthase [NAD(P)(+)]-like [Xiphias gladius]XP_039977827.1 tRNA-dihydrouridine(47) synthase [NAD(P)(+)]-like [Xiphias gladius]XP_039977828.1 tRNA-dihydrouridine(47) synthase [NAD(P)(+)]-like [Xiphias gladius]